MFDKFDKNEKTAHQSQERILITQLISFALKAIRGPISSIDKQISILSIEYFKEKGDKGSLKKLIEKISEISVKEEEWFMDSIRKIDEFSEKAMKSIEEEEEK